MQIGYLIVNNILFFVNKMFTCTLKLVYIGNSYYDLYKSLISLTITFKNISFTN